MVRFPARGPSRRHVLWAVGALVVVVSLLWWMTPGGRDRPTGTATLATGVPSGVYARYGTLLKERLPRDLPEVELGLRPSQGSVDNIEQVVAGKVDFTIAQADAVAAYLTSGGKDASRLRACARLYDDYVQLVVRADSDVESAADLRGLKVGVGQRQSGVRPVAERLLRAAGLDPAKDVRQVYEGIGLMPELLENGGLDAFFWTGGLPSSAIQDLAASSDIRLVELGSLVPALHAQDPQARHYRAAVMPADAYPQVQQGEAVESVAVANLLVTTDRAEKSLTEGLTRALIKNRDYIGSRVHAAQRVDLRTAIYTDPLPLHEGAQRYYRTVKP
ncbi:TAXI family TRAP transporter solute-binding subunit [Streptomyces sp. P38-E01]|uniref:TAXI family TRAP transporter solute-binding subunit n=1 Tax=Streptomyces tardus TaxID=2780544 RepID=A0A949N7M4_9ACTN|nr:TAXI family TRAP transporter solute-binding subunit [Streptomyces tardus]MBU7600277.1 TAXI family TRAP transporter solute-binding subunit [Streptomyces tardus]